MTTAAEPTTAAAPATAAPPTTAEPEASAPSTPETAPVETVPDTPDVTRPELVNGVERTAATADSVTVGWTPGRDDRGVTSYAVDRDGVELETVSEPEIVIAGLPCGTRGHRRRAGPGRGGQRGPARAASVQTAACAGAADLYLAPKGRDAGKCTEAAPCRSFTRAYALARARPDGGAGAGHLRPAEHRRPTRRARPATTSRSDPPRGQGHRSAR